MIVTLDWETYWSKEYSLKRMSTVDYILDPRFQVIMLSLKIDDAPARVYTDNASIKDALGTIDWASTAMLSHNCQFDASILAWHYGITPKLYLDTLSMARALTHAVTGSSSLQRVAAHLGLPAKGDTVNRAMGYRREDFTPELLREYAEYCAHDTELCRMIFDRFMGEYAFPRSELAVIDLAARMFIEPMVQLDQFKLAIHLNMLREEQARLFANQDKSVFASNPKFAALLVSMGVDVPMKRSPTTGEFTWALARNDYAFKMLCEDHTQPLAVQVVLKQRLGAKSTIEETRTATMLNLSQRAWGGNVTGWMPVPYTYYGAHTGRFSGTAGFNFANLPRQSPIRDAIRAPEGYRIVHRDASQIECRILATLAGCGWLLDGFRGGHDVYCEFAHGIYRRPITKEDKLERFTGKTAVLSLGYGAGAAKFRLTLFIGAGGVSVQISEAEAGSIVGFYREMLREIPALWRECGKWLDLMVLGVATGTSVPAVRVCSDRIELPNGLALMYPGLRQDMDPERGGWQITYRGPREQRIKLYGGKVTENVCQALARIVVTDAMRRIFDRTGYRPFMGTYDSWDYCVPLGEVEGVDRVLAEEFDRTPAWLDVPLASEGGWGVTLMDAEKGVNQ